MTISATLTALPAAPDPLVDDKTTFATKAYNFTTALVTFSTQMASIISQFNADFATINTNTNNAQIAANTAVNAPGAAGTSTTSLTIGIGSQAFTSQTGKAWQVGQTVVIASTASPLNWMVGTITAYTTGTGAMTVSTALTNGAGTFASWTVSLSGPPAPANAGLFVTGGTGTAYTLSPTPAITGYQAGQSWVIKFSAVSGAAPTLTVSGVATPPALLRANPDGSLTAIGANDIPLNFISRVTLISATQAILEEMPTSRLVAGASTTASGTAYDILNVPTWVRRITINVNNISLSGTANLFIQLGDSGGLEATGYSGSTGQGANAGSWATASASTGFTFGVAPGVAAEVITGHITFTSADPANNQTWIMSANLTNAAGKMILAAGAKTLSAILDRLRIYTTTGTDTFDAGTLSYIFEG